MVEASQYLRPALLAILCFLIFNISSVIYKCRLTLKGISYFFFCHDKTWPKQSPSDPMAAFQSIIAKQEFDKIEKKTIYFIRHGESTWNDTFNKGAHRSRLAFAIGFIPGIIKSLLYEFYLLIAGKIDSWFYDSPLSHLGLSQVQDLAKFLNQDMDMNMDVANNKSHHNDASRSLSERERLLIQILQNQSMNMHASSSDDMHEHASASARARAGTSNGTGNSSSMNIPSSKIVSSNLRRALSTVAAAFEERLKRNPQESITILPSLQEISRNPDTLSITPPQTSVKPSWIEQSCTICDFNSIFSKQVDVQYHTGNKPIDTNGMKRMTAFCNDVFTNPACSEDYIIVGGHSIWFRSFFKEFLEVKSEFVGKKKKIVNCGVVAFDLWRTSASSSVNGDDGDGDDNTGGIGGERYTYMIDEQSITVIYGGFK